MFIPFNNLSIALRWCLCFLMALSLQAVGQGDLYPHNAVNCERCHSMPTNFGATSTTVQREGISLEGKFIPAAEGGIHHRNGESAQSSVSARRITGERVSPNLLGDGYIEVIDTRDIEQNAQQQRQANFGIAGGWPTQARFWLEWGCSHVTDLVRRTN